MKSNSKRVAVAFVLDGTITGDDNFTLLRLQRALKTTFPAAKVTDIKLMSVIENTSLKSPNES